MLCNRNQVTIKYLLYRLVLVFYFKLKYVYACMCVHVCEINVIALLNTGNLLDIWSTVFTQTLCSVKL